MAGDRGLVCPEVHRLRIFEAADLLALDIDGKIDQDRAFTACPCYMEGFLNDPGDVSRVPHDIAVFDEGLAGSGNIRLLEHIAPHHLAVHLAGDTDQGDAVHKGSRDPRDEVGRAGTAGGDRYADLSCDPGVAAGRVRGALLLPDQDSLYIRFKNAVEKRTDRHAGIPEHALDSFFLQAFHNCIRAVHNNIFLKSD